ncbi:MAG: hypothetical protein OXE05_13835 [Chloroflexi bacterium]|nr:hypothetical protein [Chloroflexota bacterium]
MKRLAVLLAFALFLLLPTSVAAAECRFVLGFATLRDLIGHNIVGACLENERYNAIGDSNQQTTGGLLVWRKADNRTAFTNGYRTWINGPNGLERRLNTERFPWEPDYAPDGTPTPTPTPLPTPSPESTIVAEQDVLVSFRLENGKQVTVYREDEDTLVYTFGVPGKEPELAYRGPILAEVRAAATLWGEGVGSLAELARALASKDSAWTTWRGERSIAAQNIAQAANARESRGFIWASAITGLVSQSVYIFRTGGWEYTVASTWGRPINVPKDELACYTSYSVTVLSPQGKRHSLRWLPEQRCGFLGSALQRSQGRV